MVTASVISGSGESKLIVCTPLPGMSKRIRSAPAVPFASIIACRSEPTPESKLLTTGNVDKNAGLTAFVVPLAAVADKVIGPDLPAMTIHSASAIRPTAGSTELRANLVVIHLSENVLLTPAGH